MNSKRIVVGMSGGVDSSVAALLLQQQGYDVHGVFMKNWDDDYAPGYCSAGEDLADAQEVCDTLAIPLHKINFSAEYRERVFAHFLAEYRSARTPNPDILCNKEIKFKAFLDYAKGLGAAAIATGHYARLERIGGRTRLLKGIDPGKDQSYFLYALQQDQLSETIFPLGDLCKHEVRQMAAAADLVTSDKKDSTGICFIGERDFRAFLGHFIAPRPGPICTPEGEVLGEHQGLMFYTLGQRQGLGIGGRRNAGDAPWYVVAKRSQDNALIVAQGKNHPLLYTCRLQAAQLHWIDRIPLIPFSCRAKTRYRQADQDCIISSLQDGSCEVRFEQPQRAVTPGQSIVFYAADECLGGGIIDFAFAD